MEIFKGLVILLSIFTGIVFFVLLIYSKIRKNSKINSKIVFWGWLISIFMFMLCILFINKQDFFLMLWFLATCVGIIFFVLLIYNLIKKNKEFKVKKTILSLIISIVVSIISAFMVVAMQTPEDRLKYEQVKNEKEEKEKAKIESKKVAKEKTENEAKEKVKNEAKEKVENEAKIKAESEAKIKAESEAKAKAESKVKAKVESEAKIKKEEKKTKGNTNYNKIEEASKKLESKATKKNFCELLKVVLSQEVGEDEVIKEIKMKENTLIITIDFTETNPTPLTYNLLAEARTSSITDKILEYKRIDNFWKKITINFEPNIGSVSFEKSDIEKNEYGLRYFDPIVTYDAFNEK